MLHVLEHTGAPIAESTLDRRFEPFAAKMKRAALPPLVIDLFRHYYAQVLDGETGFISGATALPVGELAELAAIHGHYRQEGRAALERAVVVKLNGGLGTSMGMNSPKSLLTAKDGLSFLDIIVRQVLQLRQTTGARLPLVLMDSFHTHRPTLAALRGYPGFRQDVPVSFLQHKTPKITKADLSPAVWPADPSKEWCPPGHGDLYAALATSGMLDQLLEAGYEYAFVSNADNLGATLDVDVLGYFAANEMPFLMEVAHRTQADSKGGHLARRPDGQLLLREIAQCPPDELESFQDVEHYAYFNTNNLWLHLPTLHQLLTERKGVLGLPLIRNEKPVDPTHPQSYRVYQLETAMGSAIAVFEGAEALCVPRSRFIPIKKNSDLLVLWSDVYRLTDEYHLELADPERNPPLVNLDDRFYQLFDDLTARFPHGAPSLVQADELRVAGDVYFGRGVKISGTVMICQTSEAPLSIEAGAHLCGES
jgi:UTP--glucose-1-phosphate uridylyltransferase